jgi:UDP-glucuronate 4-epimerase
MDTILITGGAGFIGSHLTNTLLKNGNYRVHVLDNFNSFYDPSIKWDNIRNSLQNEHFRLTEGDIRDIGLLKTVFAQERPHILIHLAAMAGVRPSIKQPLFYEEVNIRGTANLLEVAKDSGVKKIIFASSSSVYGNAREIPFREETNLMRPISPYASTKISGELLCYTYHHLFKIPTVVLRFFTVYGPRQRPEMAIFKFTKAILENMPIELYGKASSKRDYTYIDDIIQGLIKAITLDVDFDTFNLGNSRMIGLHELVHMIEQICEKKAQVVEMPYQPGDVLLTCADISKSRSMLGYEPQTPIETGIARFVKWYRENRLNHNILHKIH